MSPWLGEWLQSGAVRGAVSGVGLVSLSAALAEFAELVADRWNRFGRGAGRLASRDDAVAASVRDDRDHP
ncbi:MAG: hypothetical protein U0Q12_09515 [Vicinamibacterales bacterium]